MAPNLPLGADPFKIFLDEGAKIKMLAIEAYSRGLLTICSSRMNANSRGAFTRGASSRICNMS